MVVSSNSSDGRKEIRKNLYAVVEEILTIHLSSTSARSRPWDKGGRGVGGGVSKKADPGPLPWVRHW